MKNDLFNQAKGLVDDMGYYEDRVSMVLNIIKKLEQKPSPVRTFLCFDDSIGQERIPIHSDTVMDLLIKIRDVSLERLTFLDNEFKEL